MNFRELLSSSSQRRLILIEELYYQEGLTTDYLLQRMKCSLPVLLNDVNLINTIYPSFKITKLKGLYYLTNQQKVSIGEVYSQMLTQSPEFQILENLLYGECKNIEHLAEKLFLSSTLTQRYLKKLATILATADIHLKYRPLRLEGKESVIRHFYYRYLQEKQQGLGEFLPNLKKYQINSLERFVNRFITKNGMSRKYVFQKRLIYNVYISLWRIKNDYYFPKAELCARQLQLPEQPIINEFSSTIMEIYRIHVTDAELKDCLWLCYSNSLINTDSELEITLKHNLRYRQLFEQHQELVADYNKLLENQLCWDKQTDLIVTILDDIYLYPKNGLYISILRQNRSAFLATTQQMHHYAISKVIKLVEAFTAKYQIYQEHDFIQNYVYLLITAVPESLAYLTREDHKVHLLLLSDLGPTEEVFLTAHIKQIIYGNFEIHHLTCPATLSCDGLKHSIKQYDGLITTANVNGLPEKFAVVVVDSFLTTQTVYDIQQMVNRLSEKKLANATAILTS